ncbi:carbohydrate kinase [Microbacterium sp. SCN 69-37]|uniref:carbohydrate kinase family protein n=1 Tax=Microbacterium sp. SCN 69-37 TaxID=1660115 RepID=UPI00086C205D|nr:carbohydrate kinase [Microbacterium sp. SCN 69-37]ODT25982.1 MAG: hypothetical protein ABS64_00390 [Microbacterium sp. SCN 69-37]
MVTVIGEALVDIVHDQPYVGGSPLNVAIGLSRLGQPTRFLTQHGDDVYGHLIAAHLEANNVTTLTTPDTAPTSVARVTLDAAGVPSYDFDIHWNLSNPDALKESDASPSLVHTGSIATMIQPGADAVLELISNARTHALISYDPNCRPTLIPDRDYAIHQVEAFVRVSDIVKASDEDLRWLYPHRSIEQSLRAFIDLGASLAIVTMGADGAYATTAHIDATTPGVPTVVADTVGAGDSFMAALIDGLLRLNTTPNASALVPVLSREQLERLLRYATAAAAITVSRPGANPPVRDELAIHADPAG